MFRPRVIPCLLVEDDRLVKTVRFRNPKYIGDPINAVRLFNDLEIDELVLLDISATRAGRQPNFERIHEIVSECFVPVAYGGGVRSLADAHRLFNLGVEKVVLNTAAIETPALISELAQNFGSQSIVVSMDVGCDWRGRQRVYSHCGKKNSGLDPNLWAKEAEKRGAGELFLNSIARDGTMDGYDLTLIHEICGAVHIPLVACGGAGSLDDLRKAVDSGASAAAAGSLFVMKGPYRAVLINYPSQEELKAVMR